jgi:hypothetical protein
MEGSPETFQSWSCASQSLTETSNDGCSAYVANGKFALKARRSSLS